MNIGNSIGDNGCKSIFINSKYLRNLKILDLSSKKKLRIVCEISPRSSKIMAENIKYLINIQEIDIGCKAFNKLK